MSFLPYVLVCFFKVGMGLLFSFLFVRGVKSVKSIKNAGFTPEEGKIISCMPGLSYRGTPPHAVRPACVRKTLHIRCGLWGLLLCEKLGIYVEYKIYNLDECAKLILLVYFYFLVLDGGEAV